MQFVNCPRCGKMFNKTDKPICKTCEKEDQDTYEKVREFVKENPDLPINVVAEETEVSVKRIMSYIRDGRLDVSRGMSADVVCMQCGKPITTGRVCDMCAKNLKTGIEKHRPKSAEPLPTSKSGKMRTRKRD